MNRNIASVLALLATVAVLNQRSASTQNAADSARSPAAAVNHAQTSPTPAAGASCQPDANCELLPASQSGPWSASCSWFLSQPSSPSRHAQSVQLDGPDPDYDHEKDWCLPAGPARPRLNFLILTVPDPVTTPLALYFDRSIDALEAAGQQYGFYPDHYWLPWPLPGAATAPGDTSHDSRVTEILNAFRSSQPGLIILSGTSSTCSAGSAATTPCATFAFLVSESPTSGIDRAQFKNAVQYAKTLSSPALPAVHVVGPFFSGSAPSAIALYTQLKDEAATIDFVSGTMTSRSQASALRDAGVRFTQTLHDDSTARDFLLCFLRQRGLTVSGGNVAILQEDETRYGNISANDPQEAATTCPNIHSSRPHERYAFPQVRYITYPRELSLLRNASADTFGVAPSVPGEPPALASQSLSWNWKDTGKDEDRMPSFSGSQQPLSQQAVLVSIGASFRCGTQAPSLSATFRFCRHCFPAFTSASPPSASGCWSAPAALPGASPSIPAGCGGARGCSMSRRCSCG